MSSKFPIGVGTRYNLPKGVYVESVGKDSPAEKAGIKKADIITKIEGKEVSNVDQLNKVKFTYNVGDTVNLTIKRGTEELEISVKLEKMPEETQITEQQTQVAPSTPSIFDFFR